MLVRTANVVNELYFELLRLYAVSCSFRRQYMLSNLALSKTRLSVLWFRLTQFRGFWMPAETESRSPRGCIRSTIIISNVRLIRSRFGFCFRMNAMRVTTFHICIIHIFECASLRLRAYCIKWICVYAYHTLGQ